MEQFTDQDLVAETRAGARVAFDELMRRHERLVYRVSFSYTRHAEDAMDVTQDVFLKVYDRLDSYRGSGTFRSWLLRIAHRENLNWLRARRRYRSDEPLAEDALPGVPATQERDRLGGAQSHRLAEAMMELRPKQRLAVSLRYYEELPIREIAAVLKSSEATTRNLLCRSLQKLRRQFVAPLGEDRA
jgi:RNA polymerase sigma-70 factor (ECF subfamily)